MAKKPQTISYTKVTPVGRRRLNPYTGEFVQLGDHYYLDANKAEMLSRMGEVEIVEEDVIPPWAKVEEPKKEKIDEKVEVKANTEAKAKA